MNVFTYSIAEGDIPKEPELDGDKFVVEDNVGEAIHVHYRTTRLEYSVKDFIRVVKECQRATEVLQNGDR